MIQFWNQFVAERTVFLVLKWCVLCCSHFPVITDLFFWVQGKKLSQKQNQRIPLKLLSALELFYSKTKYWLPTNNLWKKLKADFCSPYTVLNNMREDLISDFPLILLFLNKILIFSYLMCKVFLLEWSEFHWFIISVCFLAPAISVFILPAS